MYSKGDIVVYGMNGICEIGEVSTLDINGVAKEKEYYTLYPRSNDGKIYFPVDSATSKMRNILS